MSHLKSSRDLLGTDQVFDSRLPKDSGLATAFKSLVLIPDKLVDVCLFSSLPGFTSRLQLDDHLRLLTEPAPAQRTHLVSVHGNPPPVRPSRVISTRQSSARPVCRDCLTGAFAGQSWLLRKNECVPLWPSQTDVTISGTGCAAPSARSPARMGQPMLLPVLRR